MIITYKLTNDDIKTAVRLYVEARSSGKVTDVRVNASPSYTGPMEHPNGYAVSAECDVDPGAT